MKEMTSEVCDRMRRMRIEHYGHRGKSSFARDLGIPISTYVHYEIDRLPPIDILLRASRLTHTRLDWLISGVGERREPLPTRRSPRIEALLRRIEALLQARPGELPQLELALAQIERQLEPGGRLSDAMTAAARHGPQELIPILGSTAAGTAHYWHELAELQAGPEADARLESLIEACAGPGEETAAQFGQRSLTGAVSLVQCSQPNDHGLVEFLCAPDFKARHPRSVAWRIDGESMAPRYLDGDFVLASPDVPAATGHPCVARQRGQIGVNCKLFAQTGDQVQLIPVNPDYPTQELPESELLWAWRVLGSVRLA